MKISDQLNKIIYQIPDMHSSMTSLGSMGGMGMGMEGMSMPMVPSLMPMMIEKKTRNNYSIKVQKASDKDVATKIVMPSPMEVFL